MKRLSSTCLALFLSVAAASAQGVPSVEDIVRGLRPAAPATVPTSPTRSLRPAGPTRAITVEPALNAPPADPAPPLSAAAPLPAAPVVVPPAPATSVASTAPQAVPAPSIDLEILFEYNSAALTPEAVPTLMVLGRALTDPRLAGSAFMIAGHTDGRGSPAYNLDLSQRRAKTVKDFLVTNFKLDERSVVSAGFGSARLKNPANPAASENRRVQVINTKF